LIDRFFQQVVGGQSFDQVRHGQKPGAVEAKSRQDAAGEISDSHCQVNLVILRSRGQID
jgi:hypothetical protein